ncbi:RNA polymerase sigma factor [Sunxiuqinia elliptica]|uniref:RNA polymerase sigma factor (Sigma-70 family) n=1 Tax=Sunxiuqinia elliptica TaxID=655355 RepID=A0A4R6GXF3_9BACT|nr:sigma-70 family RNA polymerase sigma factor [Sunxiuqinia elliptica]TDO00018.1 RNA polymerase sigma factor (sigma-70 family) [Sunxiuqinia elliptica]TDO57209.1 RNA polymerase sigma factor (sigma-70 family) [Sunxiuqinia elliptica]
MNEMLNHRTKDNELWKELKRGNELGYSQLFRKYYSDLYFYGLKLSSDPDLTKECIQEMFVRIWETKERLSTEVHVKSYLLISLRRLVFLRINENEKNHSLENRYEDSFLFEESDFIPHEEVPEDVKRCIQKAISELTARQRELILLFFYQGLSYKEIASIIDISIPAVRNLMYRTLIRLREKIGATTIESMKNILFLVFSSLFLEKVENF